MRPATAPRGYPSNRMSLLFVLARTQNQIFDSCDSPFRITFHVALSWKVANEDPLICLDPPESFVIKYGCEHEDF